MSLPVVLAVIGGVLVVGALVHVAVSEWTDWRLAQEYNNDRKAEMSKKHPDTGGRKASSTPASTSEWVAYMSEIPAAVVEPKGND